jgi:hypothetical protein
MGAPMRASKLILEDIHREIKIIGNGKIYNIFPPFVKYLVKFEIDTMCS